MTHEAALPGWAPPPVTPECPGQSTEQAEETDQPTEQAEWGQPPAQPAEWAEQSGPSTGWTGQPGSSAGWDGQPTPSTEWAGQAAPSAGLSGQPGPSMGWAGQPGPSTGWMGQPGAPPEWPPSAGRGIPAEPGGPYDPASWSEGPYGLLPRPPRRSNNAVLAAAVVGALVVALLIAGVVALGGGGSTDSAKLAAEAARGLADAPGLSYQGTFGDKPASFGVTAAGSARGTYTSHDSLVAMVSVDGAVYLRANQGFWTGRGDSASDAERAAGRWTKAPDSALDIDASRLLAPGRVAQALRQATAEPNPQRSSIHGTSTVKVSSGELTYYVSTGKPYRLVRVEGIGDEDWSLDVTVLSRSTVGTVFSALRKDVAGLQDAYDPSVGVLPGRLAFGLCDATGCEIRVPARATGGGSGRAVRITMSAYISGQGEKKGDCSDTKTVRGTRSVTLACVVRGGWPAYYKWMRSTPGSHTYDGHAEFSATVNSARDVADLLAKLTRERQGS